MNSDEVKDKLAELHSARINANEAKVARQELLKQWQESQVWKAACEEEDTAMKIVENLEQQIKDEAIHTAELLPSNKHPFPGVTVKDVTKFVYDLENADVWCRKNLPTVLTLDKKRFELAVKTGVIVPQDVAHMETVKRAEIASDLSKHINL